MQRNKIRTKAVACQVFSFRLMKTGCYAKPGSMPRARTVSAYLNPWIIDARFLDCGPKKFLFPEESLLTNIIVGG
jgi:hypothetical protein